MSKSEKERKEIHEKYEKAEKERVKINDKYIKLSQRLKEPHQQQHMSNFSTTSNTMTPS